MPVATVQIRNYTSYTGDYYTGGRFYTGNDLETGAYQEGNIAVKYSQVIPVISQAADGILRPYTGQIPIFPFLRMQL